jgi:ankyrin repeat protein
LYITNIESEKILDPYINVDHFLKLIKENSEYSILPDEVNLSSNDNIINYLYNNINTLIPLNENRYSVIYMIVKYAYNKEIIENEEESEENKEFAKTWNKTFEDLIGKLYSIDETDRIFREIKRNNELVKENMNLFLEAIERGRMDILEIMRPYLQNDIEKRTINKAYEEAARNGHLEVLKWLKENLNITEEEFKSYNNQAFTWAARYGYLEVLKWLKVNFNITEEEFKSYNNQAFIWAAGYGHLEVLKWLKATFNMTKEDLKSKIDNSSAFIRAAQTGHLEVLKWLKKTFKITKEEAKLNNNEAFIEAAGHGHLEVLKWLKEKFNITEKEAKSKRNEAFRQAARYGYLDILKWLKDTYNITKKK